MRKYTKEEMLLNFEDYYIEYLIEKLGPLMFKAKPAEFLSYSNSDLRSAQKINIIESIFEFCHKIAYRKIEYKKCSWKIFFYNPEKLNNTLKKDKNLFFLKKLGFPKKYDMDLYIDYLLKKISDGEIPPELGIFLGYLLKDVKGFMGVSNYELTKIKGWRFYGDPKLSDKIYSEIMIAREKIKNLLSQKDPKDILFAF